MTAATRRVQLEPGFLLHHYPWRDSSRILEVLTLSHGRVALFARAARRSGSGLPAALQPFAELLVSWSGRGEAVRMTAAERAATAPSTLAGARLMSGFYANELVIRLLPRNDPHPELYAAYATLLAGLADVRVPAARSLRIFEKRLLEALGYALNLDGEAGSGRPLRSRGAWRACRTNGTGRRTARRPGHVGLGHHLSRFGRHRHWRRGSAKGQLRAEAGQSEQEALTEAGPRSR